MKLIIQLLKNFFSKPATVDFPNKKLKISKKVRGSLAYDRTVCVSSYECIKVCPANALRVNPKTKKIIIDRGKCVLCGNCVAVCPAKALSFSQEVLNATTKREDLIIE